jgi:hypothetical protein
VGTGPMNAEMLADLVAIVRPAVTALAKGSKGRTETAFARLEVDLSRWAVRHGVSPEGLDQAARALRSDDALRQAFHRTVTQPDHIRPAAKGQ